MNCWEQFKRSKAYETLDAEERKFLHDALDGLSGFELANRFDEVIMDLYNQARNLSKQEQVVDDMVQGAVDNNIHKGKIRSWLGGSIFDYFKNKVDSAIGLAQNLSAKHLSMLYDTLESKDILKVYQRIKDDPKYYADKVSLLRLVQQGESAFTPEALAKIPTEVKQVAKEVREFLGQNGFIKSILKINPNIGVIKNYGLPFSLDGSKLRTHTFDGFRGNMDRVLTKFRAKYFNDDATWDVFLREWYSDLTGSSSNLTKRMPKFDFYSRKLFFDDLEGQYSTLERYGHLENGLFNVIEHHVISLTTKSALWQSFGNNPVQAINKAINEISQIRREAQGLTPDEVAQFNTTQRNLHDLLIAARDGSPDPTTLSYVSDTLKNLASIFYLGSLFLRDIGSDKATLTAFNTAAMQGGSILNNFTKFYGAFSRYVADPKYRAAAKETLRTMQGSLEHANIRRIGEMGIHHVKLELGKGRSITQASAQQVANWSRRMADGFFRAGMMNHSRTFHTHQMAYTLKSSFSTVNRTKAYNQIQPRLREILNSHGIFEREYNLLKKAKRRIMSQSKDDVLEIEAIRDISSDDLRSIARRGETRKETRARLDNAYKSFIHNEVRKASGEASYSDLFLTSQHRPATDFGAAAISHGTRFMPAALTFWRQLNDNIAALSSGSAYQSGSKITYAAYSAGRLASMTTTGIGIMWLSDLARGRSPRELNAKTVALAAIGAGLGGAYGMILTSLILTEGRRVLGAAPTVAMVQKVVDYVRDPSKERAVQLSRQFSGIGNLWYTEWAFRSLFYDAIINYPHTDLERGYMREAGQQNIAPRWGDALD